GVERVFAVRREPVEVFGAVVDRVEPPEEADAVLEPVAPVNAEVTQEHNLDHLEPEGLRGDYATKAVRHDAGESVAEVREAREDEAVPEEVLAEEEEQIGQPVRAEEPLAGPGGEEDFERPEEYDEEHEAQAGREQQRGDGHGNVPSRATAS